MKCSLRPVELEDLELFEEQLYRQENIGDLQWFGYRNQKKPRIMFEQDGLLTPDQGTLKVVSEEETVGRVHWRISHWGPPETSWCWEIGVAIFRDHRQRGLGTQAQQLLVQYLFLHTHAQRIQAVTDTKNVPEQRALQKAGFGYEGRLRDAQWRSGAWHDQLIYSILRSEWATTRKEGLDAAR